MGRWRAKERVYVGVDEEVDEGCRCILQLAFVHNTSLSLLPETHGML